jgi:hypothetical protein
MDFMSSEDMRPGWECGCCLDGGGQNSVPWVVVTVFY